MSFIITVYTNEGIVMASDSRTTYTTTVNLPNGIIERQFGTQITDTTNKTFLTPSNVGISTCGDATIGQTPIAGFIEDFISQKTDEHSSVNAISSGLINYFSDISPNLDTIFIVAGYNENTFVKEINRIYIRDKKIVPVKDTQESGAVWNGETDTLVKLINRVATRTELSNPNGEVKYSDLPFYCIGFNVFTLQDAINFAEYAVDVTIKTMRFQERVKTVGGPIDILVIQPNNARWLAHKELHA